MSSHATEILGSFITDCFGWYGSIHNWICLEAAYFVFMSIQHLNSIMINIFSLYLFSSFLY